ncbi:MAG: hypothetical protein AAB372_00850 [Patescibacteria group bacterium]
MAYALLIVDITLTVAAQLLLRTGAARLSGQGVSFSIILEPLKNMFLLGGMVLYGVSFFLYILVLSRLQLNMLYPVATGSALVLITILSYIFFRETLTVLQVTGIVAILLGIVLVLLPR